MNAMLTLGSLFDGIGGFPLAGIRQGIVPVWASEIEQFPIEVTKLHFPKILHVGDITKLKGAELPTVDIITGGSPCQDLSLAGKRQGLAGERSGLFMEQIRIIKEMREHDAGRGWTNDTVRPRYMVWENVPGAFSSADGEDFRVVLEETCRIADSSVSIPRPSRRIWLPAGTILGEKFSLAWRVLDAQYWGLAQRRKRIFLVADFGGHTAPEILFKQDRVFRGTTSGEETWQGTAPTTPECVGNTSRQTACSGGINIESRVLCLNDQGGKRMDVTIEFAATLRAQMAGHPPLVLGSQQDGTEFNDDLCPTTSTVGASENKQTVLFEKHGIEFRYAEQDDGTYSEQEESYCIAGNIIDRQDHNGGKGIGVKRDISYTLNTVDRHCVFSPQRCDEYISNEVVSTQSARQYKDATDLVCEMEVAGVDCRSATEYGDLCGTLQSHPSGGYSLNTLHPVRIGKLVRHLTPLECERLMGFPEHWTDIPKASDSGRYKALGNSVAIPCVEFVLRGISNFLRKSKEERKS